MAYFMIDGEDYSMYVNQLTVNKEANYNAQTNASGNTVVDFVNHKRILEVGIIPLDSATMAALQTAINAFNVSVSFRNPQTGELEENFNCIIPNSEVEYYTIRVNEVLYNAFTLKFIEL